MWWRLRTLGWMEEGEGVGSWGVEMRWDEMMEFGFG
jgi:hypothetical protein